MIESKHFKHHELECRCNCGRNKITRELLDLLEDLRVWYGKPIRLSSAFRCQSHNNAVSSTGTTGPHTTGQAVDILVYGNDAICLVKGALSMGFSGVGVNQKGNRGALFIHLDTLSEPNHCPRPWMWSY